MYRASLIGTFLVISVGWTLVGGCSRQPDPKANPDFNEKALTDPGSAVKGLSESKHAKGK